MKTARPLPADDSDSANDNAPLSKTRRKRQMEELQTLGEELVALSTDQVRRIDIPEELRDAIIDAQRMAGAHEALRRQMQYIGKLMRSVDPDPMREALALIRGESASDTARLHRLEKMRSQLLERETTLHEIAVQYPGVDLQHLRALRRSAIKEREQNKPPRSFRAIFQLLKDLDQAESTGEPTSAEAP